VFSTGLGLVVANFFSGIHDMEHLLECPASSTNKSNILLQAKETYFN
jgi:hypothetical protein